MSCDMHADVLDAYLDENLPGEDLAAFEDHLRGCPSCAAEALARMQMKRATRAAAASLALSPEFSMRPEFRLHMEKSLQKSSRRVRMRSWMPWLAAAALALLLAAVSIGLFTRHAAREQALAELLDLHVATMASANPVDVVSTDRHTVKPWFQGKLPFTFNLPEIGDSQYRLLGGKLVYFNHAPGAQLLFDLRKHQLSVFIVQEQPGILPLGGAVAETSDKGFSVESWTQAGLRYVIISDTSSPDVHALGDLLRTASK
jgi:anti-sigma factor RsiW